MYLTNPCRLHSFIQTSLPAETEELNMRQQGQLIKILRFHVCFLKVHFSTFFLFLVSFTSLFHHCLSLPLWAIITFAFLHSASICYLFFTIATPPTASALWHFFPSGGLRPAVAVWFELFQVFLQQQREIVMVLAGCVHTNSWGMRFTKQRVRKCWKLTEYIFYIYSIQEQKEYRTPTGFL